MVVAADYTLEIDNFDMLSPNLDFVTRIFILG